MGELAESTQRQYPALALELVPQLDEPRTKRSMRSPRITSLQRNRNPAKVGGELHSRLWTSQGNDDAVLVLKSNASGAPNQGATSSYGAVGTGEIADVLDARRPAFETADRSSRRDTEAETGHAERIVAAAIGQDTAAAAGTHHQARLHELDPNVAGRLRE